MAECNQLSCPDPATHTVHWPGGSKTMCDGHAQIAINIARSMGFEVRTEPIAAPDTVTLPRAVVERLHRLLPRLQPQHYHGKDGRDSEAENAEIGALLAKLDAALKGGGGG